MIGRILGVAVLSLAGIVACNSKKKTQESATPVTASQNTATVATASFHNDAVVPPKEYFTALQDRSINFGLATTSILDKTQVIYLNFKGATVKKGYLLDQSFIPCQATTTIPTSGLDDATIASVVSMVQDHYTLAGVKVNLVTAKPTDTLLFTTIHVGGVYGDLGCADDGNTLGIAPIDANNLNPSDVGFVFQKRLADPKSLALAIAHEAGHTFGLDHVTAKGDIMYPALGTGSEQFLATSVTSDGKAQDEPAMLRKSVGSIDATTTDTSTSTDTGTSATDVSSWSTYFKSTLVALDALFNNKIDINSITSGGSTSTILQQLLALLMGSNTGNLSASQLNNGLASAKVLKNLMTATGGATTQAAVAKAVSALSASDVAALKNLFGANLFGAGDVSTALKAYQDKLMNAMPSGKITQLMTSLRAVLFPAK